MAGLCQAEEAQWGALPDGLTIQCEGLRVHTGDNALRGGLGVGGGPAIGFCLQVGIFAGSLVHTAATLLSSVYAAFGGLFKIHTPDMSPLCFPLPIPEPFCQPSPGRVESLHDAAPANVPPSRLRVLIHTILGRP